MTDKGNSDGFYFPGFQAPSYTQVPDEAFDVLMARLSPAEFKVMMYIIRRTFGFKKSADAISLSQIVSGVCTKSGKRLDMGTGLSRQGVVNALAGLVQKNVVLTQQRQSAERGFESTLYCLNIVGYGMQFPDPEDPRYQALPDTPPSQLSLLGASQLSGLAPSQLSGLEQDTDVIQETEQQQHPSPSTSLTVQEPRSATAPQPDVVVASDTSRPTANDPLLDQLAALGVALSTAQALLRNNDPAIIQRWLAYTEHKLSHGWVPQESPAAWLVSAIRSKDWVIPDWFETPQEREQRLEQQAGLAAEERIRRERDAQAEQRQAEVQRQAIESELGIGKRTRDTWDRARALLAERRQSSPALLSSYLLPIRGSVATIATPVDFFRGVIEARVDPIRDALSEVTGKPIATVQTRHIDLSTAQSANPST